MYCISQVVTYTKVSLYKISRQVCCTSMWAKTNKAYNPQAYCRGLFWWDWAASYGNGLGCLLRWWTLVFLSKGAWAGSIVTQLGPVCAQTYAMSARSKFTTSRIVADKLWQAGLLQTSYGRLDCCRQVMADRYNNN